MLNVISIDVEEYFHAANLAAVAGPSRWQSLESRVEHSTELVLNILERNETKATFFVLGWSAKRHPHLVKTISNAGHEIASHGYSHRIVYNQSPRQFSRDIRISKQLLEDLSGKEVIGYRAPNFSITDDTPWAHNELVKAGYKYDSSLYPIWHPRYANPNKNTQPHIIECEAGALAEFPLAVAKLTLLGREFRLPVAGGAYWRLLPMPLMKLGLDSMLKSNGQWFTSYLHPWELDTGQPKFSNLPFLTQLRHYGGTARFERKLESILQRYEFSPLCEAASQSLDVEWKQSSPDQPKDGATGS